MGRKRRSPGEKARIAVEALKEDKPLHEIAEKYGVHPNMISQWKRQLLENADELFRNHKGSKQKELEQKQDELYKHVGRVEIEKDFLKKKLKELGISE